MANNSPRNRKEAFLAKVAPAALAIEYEFGVPHAAVIIAAAALESAWGHSRLFTKANNPFGLKNLKGDLGEYVAETTEYEQGKPQRVKAGFEDFPDLASAFRAYAQLFHRLERYKPVLAAKDPCECAKAIQACGYATDPDYAVKLMRIIHDYHLDDRRELLAWASKNGTGGASGLANGEDAA